MKTDKNKVTIAVLVFVIIAAIILGGLVWTITQGIRARKFAKTVATVTSVEKNEERGDFNVLVSYEADGQVYENASYIGDLSRCYEGLQMRVYYSVDGDRSYVYSKSSDLGFALIMLCCGVVWAGAAVVVTVCLRNAGYFRGADNNDSGE